MRKKFKIFAFIILVLPLSGITNAQYFEDDKQTSIIKDDSGRIITTSQTRLKLFISTDSLGKKPAEILQKDNETESLELQNQGKHRIIIYAPGRRQLGTYSFFVDNAPPKTIFQTDSNYLLYNDTIVAATGFELSLASKDNIAGIKHLYVKVDDEAYSMPPEKLVFDKEKYYTLCFYAIDMVGNKESDNCYIVFIDNSPPKTNLEIIKDSFENIVSARSEFKLKATDKHGIKETWYWFNDEKPTLYKKPVSVSKFNEGSHKFHYYSADNLGNKEEINTFDFYIDKTPPIIFEEILGNSFIRDGREYSSGRSQLRLTAIDNKAGVKAIYYSINGQEYQLYEGSVFLSMVSGNINIRFYALDNVNNKSQSSVQGASTAIPYVDLNAPEISHSVKEPKALLRDTLFISPKTEIVLNAIDHESGLNRVIYSISNHPETDFNKPFAIEEQGYYNIHYTAFDNVDNANNDNFDVFVDASGPEIEVIFSIKSYNSHIVDGQKVAAYQNHLQVFLAATDFHTGVKRISYVLNGGRTQQYRGHVSGFLNDQVNTLEIIASDILGNESKKEIQFYIY